MDKIWIIVYKRQIEDVYRVCITASRVGKISIKKAMIVENHRLFYAYKFDANTFDLLKVYHSITAV